MSLPEGYVALRLLIFRLPSEWRGASVKFRKKNNEEEKRSEGEESYEALIGLKRDPYRISALRRRFYNQLNNVAYWTSAGWVLLPRVDPRESRAFITLTKILREYKAEFGFDVTLKIVKIFVPKEQVEEWISENIIILEKKAAEMETKILEETDEEKRERKEKKLMSLQERIEELKRELETVRKWEESAIAAQILGALDVEKIV